MERMGTSELKVRKKQDQDFFAIRELYCPGLFQIKTLGQIVQMAIICKNAVYL